MTFRGFPISGHEVTVNKKQSFLKLFHGENRLHFGDVCNTRS
jgi:hypothetical protein